MSAAMTEEQAKLKFAALLLQHPGNPIRCAEILAASVSIADPALIHRVATNWPNDPGVLDEQKRLLAELGPEHFLPSKQDLARLVWGIADSGANTEDRLKAAKQYAELMGYIEKNKQPQITVINKVMEIKNYGNDEDWEMAALRQQSKLIEHEPA